MSAIAPILKAIRAVLSNNTTDNINALATLAGLKIEQPTVKVQIVEHTTKKGKVIRGVVRTDLSYAEAKAIDEYTFKKDGGWFIRDKYLGLESQPIASQQTPTETAQNEPVAVVQQETLVSDDDNNIEALERKFKPASKKYKQPEIRLQPKEGAKLLKQTLTKLFPDTKFSVVMARGTAYGSVDVSWADGASYDLVDVIARHFKGKGFDGSDDSTHYLYALNDDGKVIDYGLGYISISRKYSREFLEKVHGLLPEHVKQDMMKEGVTIKDDASSAYFDNLREHWTRERVYEAMRGHSTGKYNFGNAPQAANDEPVGKDEKREFLQGLLKYANEEVSTFVDDSGNNIKRVQKTVNGQFASWQYNKFRELFGLARTVVITNSETVSEGINLTGRYVSEYNNYHAYSISYEPIEDDKSVYSQLQPPEFVSIEQQKENQKQAKLADAKTRIDKLPIAVRRALAHEIYTETVKSQGKHIDSSYPAMLKPNDIGDMVAYYTDKARKEPRYKHIVSIDYSMSKDYALDKQALKLLAIAGLYKDDYLNQVPLTPTNNQPNLIQDKQDLDPAIKDMVKDYYDLIHSTYVDEQLANPELEAWERKEYQQVKDDNIAKKNQLEKHLNETVSGLGIDWKSYYKQLSSNNEAPPEYNSLVNNAENTTVESETKQSIGRQTLKLEDVLVEWKPRFKWSVQPEYRRLKAEMKDVVFNQVGDMDMLKINATVSMMGQAPSAIAKEQLEKINLAKKHGFYAYKLQIKSELGYIFVNKSDMVLTKEGVNRLLTTNEDIFERPEFGDGLGYEAVIGDQVSLAKAFVKWADVYGNTDDLATITKRLNDTGFSQRYRIVRPRENNKAIELQYFEEGKSQYRVKITSNKGDWASLKDYIYFLANITMADHNQEGKNDLWFVIHSYQKGENNVPSTSNALESDIKPTSTPDSQQGIKNSNDDESGQSGRMARPSINRPNEGGGSQRDRSIGLSENDGISLGIGSDTSVSGVSGQRGTGSGAKANESSGSDSTNGQRSPIKRERDRSIVRSARATGTITADTKEAEQLKAEGTPTQWGDAQNIAKALPYLLPEQHGDVAKAEKRLIDDNKNGILFTNGTGTGKSFTGLGAVKRFVNAGKKNILIVSMNDKIIKDFIKSAKKLALDIHQLDGITDNGKDKIVATTYANLAQNDTLGMRDWDLIIVDESHNLMQGEKGENTEALAKLRALSGHHAGFNDWVKMRHADKDPKPIGESPETGLPIYNQDEVIAWEEFKKPLRKQWQEQWASQPKGRTKVIFLSATPFSYVKTLEWAEGYLFDLVPPAEKFSEKADAMGLAYNSGGAYERFYMSNFGYKMRTNKLTRPDAKVDVGILERKFAEKLKTEGAMSGRELSVPFDYDRKFVLISSKVGEKIDEGFNYLWDTKDKDDKSKYSDLLRVINKRFDYLARLQLLEAIKAQEAIEQIKKHLALGRKVIVFHDYNVGGATNPFVVKQFSGDAASAAEAQYHEFQRERPDLIGLKLDIPAPLITLRKAFPNALMFNGTVSKGQRLKNADLFNADGSSFDLMIAQSDAAATGISFHDTTGKHQRVILNIGMPTKPAKLRQTEGRIYRVGQASNAIQRYLTTGTNWERSAFAQKIAERAETVDNLAQGESAVVSIKDALVRAYESAEYFEPSENDGIGGKAYDEENNRVMALSPFERAKTEYWVKQKVTAKRGEREGKEWYATPEPVGLFMVNLAGAHSGDDILEPSAGDGAIGRYMPSDASVTFVEPSESLASRARMNNTNANVIVDGFEEHGTNNKYDAIVMNPPFGSGGSIAIKHLVKSFEHLRDGGRVVALLPIGKMDELIAKYQDMGYFKDIYKVAEFALPSSTFENAGTRVNTKIHVFEKHEFKTDVPNNIVRKDLSYISNINDLFDAIENISIKPRKPRVDEALAEYGIEIYPERNKYIVTGEGLKRDDIKRTILTAYAEPNKDGDYVEKYNRGSAYVKWLKVANIPTMEQFNKGLSANNLPIKYQQRNNKFNTWDGVGDMPDWLRGAIRFGAKLEDFAVEKPVYDSVTNNDHKVIVAAIRKLMANNTPENARALAEAAGLSIEKPRPLLSSEDIKGLNKTLVLPENSSQSDRRRVVTAWLKENLLGKHIKTSDGKLVYFNSKVSVDHLKHNGRRNDLMAKAVTYIADVFAFGQFIERQDLAHERKEDFVAFHVYRKWCEVDGLNLHLEAHAAEHQNGTLELVAYNQKKVQIKEKGLPVGVEDAKDTQATDFTLLNNNKSVFDDAQVSDDLTVEDGDLVRILEVKALAVNDEPQLSANQVLAKAGINGIDYNLSLNDYGKLLGFNDDEVSDILLFAKESFNDDSEYAKLIKEISSAIYEAKTGLKKPDTLHTTSQYKAYAEKISKLNAAQDLLGYAQKRFENPFLYRGKEQMPQFLKARFEKRFEQVPTGDKARDEKSKKEYAWQIELLKKAFDENNRFDDIGGFNFEPMVSVDTTMQAIKKLMAENTLDNARYLAMITGLKLKADEPSQDLDMFGEPINQDFDLFGEPIQDGDESPVEELPRLAVVELPLNKLTLSDDVPQFKSGADGESGVVEALGGKFDRTGVAPIQVWERTDGRLEIISGRHRTDLARRSGEKTIPAQVHKESEGFTAKQAMMLDAELNIRDGQGKVKDYVDYFTHSEISEDEAERRGLIARSIGQRAFTIASKGSEELKTLHRNEIISDQAAADIASIAPNNSAMQAVGLRVLQEHKPLNNALNTIRAVQALTREKGQEPDTFDLFGFDDSALKEAEAMAKIASRKQRQIAEQLNAIKGAVKNPKLAAKHGVVVENEADALAKVQTMTAQKARWDNWSSHADLLAEVRKELNDKLDSLDYEDDDYYWLCQEELAA